MLWQSARAKNLCYFQPLIETQGGKATNCDLREFWKSKTNKREDVGRENQTI